MLTSAKVQFSIIFYGILNLEKCPYSEFFWSVYSRIRIEYGPE